jgi:hypothetical protein
MHCTTSWRPFIGLGLGVLLIMYCSGQRSHSLARWVIGLVVR